MCLVCQIGARELYCHPHARYCRCFVLANRSCDCHCFSGVCVLVFIAVLFPHKYLHSLFWEQVIFGFIFTRSSSQQFRAAIRYIKKNIFVSDVLPGNFIWNSLILYMSGVVKKIKLLSFSSCYLMQFQYIHLNSSPGGCPQLCLFTGRSPFLSFLAIILVLDVCYVALLNLDKCTFLSVHSQFVRGCFCCPSQLTCFYNVEKICILCRLCCLKLC